MAAAVILVAMPPRPSPLPARATVTASRSAGRLDVAQQPGARRARVAVVQAVDVGEQHQRVRADDVRDERGEPVVVTHPDLVGGHRVVLVHHRQHLEPEQALQRALRVAVVRAADHVVGGEQHLADGLAVAGERPRVRLGEQELADRGRRLLGGEVARAAGQPQRREPCRDRPRRDEHHLAARGAALGEGVDERVQPGRVQAAVQRRQRRRPHLHDDPPGGGDRGRHRVMIGRERHVTVRPTQTVTCSLRAAIIGRDHYSSSADRRSASLRCTRRPARAPYAPPRRCGRSAPAAGRCRGPTADRDPGGRAGLPVERDVADRHRAAGHRARRGERVLHAEPLEPVAEVADGLVVVERGLSDPALRTGAAHDERRLDLRVGFDRETGVVDGLRTQHHPRRLGHRLRGADARTAAAMANVSSRSPAWLAVEIGNTGQPNCARRPRRRSRRAPPRPARRSC